MASLLQSMETLLYKLSFLLVPAALSVILVAASVSAQTFTIAVTVNDQPISEWDVGQRVKFYQATGGGRENVEKLRKRALDELVEEQLISQEARRLGLSVEETRVVAAIEQRLKPLKRNYAQFKQYLSSRKVDISTLENQVRWQLAWSTVVGQTFRNQVSISETDISEAAEEVASKSENSAEELFILQKIHLEVPEGSDDLTIVRRMKEAEEIRKFFVDCKRNKSALKHFDAVSIEDPKLS